jgi:hypothetical protein
MFERRPTCFSSDLQKLQPHVFQTIVKKRKVLLSEQELGVAELLQQRQISSSQTVCRMVSILVSVCSVFRYRFGYACFSVFRFWYLVPFGINFGILCLSVSVLVCSVFWYRFR